MTPPENVLRTPSSLRSTEGQDPHAWYDSVRDAGELLWDEEMNAYLATSHDLVREISRKDNFTWRSTLVWSDETMVLDDVMDLWRQWMGSEHRLISLDGEAQKRVHRWWMAAFSERALAHWRDTAIRPIVNQQIDRFADADRVDLVDRYADRCSSRVILAVMGLPGHDDEWIDRLYKLTTISDKVFEYSTESPPREVLEPGAAATQEIHSMLMDEVLRRRDEPAEDFISMVWAGADEIFGGEDYTEHDVANQALQAFLAGSDTTASMTANGLYLLLTDDELQERVRHGDARARAAFVEEAMRMYGAISFRPRIAKRDVEIEGTIVKKGEMVIALSNVAGRDPDRYAQPERADLDRVVPTDHFGFWRGPRQCPGRALARMELEEIYGLLLDRFSGLRLDPDAEPPRFEGFFIRKWAPLNTLLTHQ
jgi:cytochrome P450